MDLSRVISGGRTAAPESAVSDAGYVVRSADRVD
jgi:hypothetical protein